MEDGKLLTTTHSPDYADIFMKYKVSSLMYFDNQRLGTHLQNTLYVDIKLKKPRTSGYDCPEGNTILFLETSLEN